MCRNLLEDSNREIQNLKNINDNYPKYIVTLDKYDVGNIDGIEIIYLELVNCADWCFEYSTYSDFVGICWR